MQVCKNDFAWIIIGAVIVIISVLHVRPVYMHEITDIAYHSNRMYQIVDCIDKDLPLWFYNNDLQGLGYGSSFFYGWLTLLPFVPVYKYVGTEAFIFSYHLVSGFVFFAGLYTFARRFTDKNAGVISVLFLLQPVSFVMYFTSSLMPWFLGTGLCFVFYSFCVDFFRGRKSFIPACICWFILFNTHLLCSVFGFIGSVVICLYYWNKYRIKDYILFAVSCFILCLWNIVQIGYYIVGSSDKLSDAFILDKSLTLWSLFGISGITFGVGVVIYNIITEFAIVVMLFRKRPLRQCFVILMCFGLIVFSTYEVFIFINNRVNTIIQFPSRIFAFIFYILLLVCFRGMRKDILRLLIVYSVIPFLLYLSVSLVNTNISEFKSYRVNNETYIVSELNLERQLFCYIGNGEYLPSNSNILDTGLIDADSGYDSNSGVVSIDLTNKAVDSIEVKRLYYKGYKSNAGECIESENGYVEVNTNNFSGILKIWYEYPLVLRCMFIISYIFVGMIVMRLVYARLFRYAL